MLHTMKLKDSPFEKIKNGTKTIELRLNDEKRQQLKTGDFIEFSCIGNPSDKIQTRVIALHYFDSFEELYNSLPLLKCGYTDETVKNARSSDMDKFYSAEEQKKYGVVGIELEISNLQRFINGQNIGYMYCENIMKCLKKDKTDIKK